MLAATPDSSTFYMSGNLLYSSNNNVLVSAHYSDSNSPETQNMVWLPASLLSQENVKIIVPSCEITQDFYLNCTVWGAEDQFSDWYDAQGYYVFENGGELWNMHDPEYEWRYDVNGDYNQYLVDLQIVGVGC